MIETNILKRRDFIATAGVSSLVLLLNGCGIGREKNNQEDNLSSSPFIFQRFGLPDNLSPNPSQSSSLASGVSRDGTVIVGSNTHGAFRWTQETGAVQIGEVAVSFPILSGDGDVIVGTGGSFGKRVEAFRWTAKTGMVSLGHLPGAVGSEAIGVSYDGSVVIGTSGEGVFRWTQETGMVGLVRLPSVNRCIVTALSSDGKVIIGMCNNTPFRWTQETGMVLLSPLTKVSQEGNTIVSEPGFVVVNALSPDGSVVYGTSGPKAYRWTQETDMVIFNEITELYNQILSVSGDGRVILGESSGISYIRISNKTYDLKEKLISVGAPLKKYKFMDDLLRISEDGKTIIGQIYPTNQSYNNTHFEAFRLYHPQGFSSL
jgi:uncharacterized membrane protein